MSPTSAPTIEGLPQAARARTREGANAFVRYYIEQLNEAWSTPRTDVLPAFALPSCKTCANYQKTAVDLRAKGQRYRSALADPIAVDGTGENKPSDPKYTVVAPVRLRSVALLDRNGDVVSEGKESRASLFFELAYRGQGWVIAEIQGLQ